MPATKMACPDEPYQRDCNLLQRVCSTERVENQRTFPKFACGPNSFCELRACSMNPSKPRIDLTINYNRVLISQ